METLKQVLFFPVATYFSFFAKIRLSLWKPKVIVATGSSGKTTVLHMIEAQLGGLARYSHHANSAFGVPFNILGLERKSLNSFEWIKFFILTPFFAFKAPFKEKIYVVEADADRPNEAKFLANLLNPTITIWLNVSRTHSLNFQSMVPSEFETVDAAIAYEFGHFLERTKEFSIINEDSPLILKQVARAKAKVEGIKEQDLKEYKPNVSSTVFNIGGVEYSVHALLPKENYYSINAVIKLLFYLSLPLDKSFAKFNLPPGRSSVYEGIKQTTLIDSSYNANLGSMKAVLSMFGKLDVKEKWVVLGDMLEQGILAKEEHEKLAAEIESISPAMTVLLGKLVSEYTYPLIKGKAEKFTSLPEALSFIEKNIKGKEAILFKGSQSIMLDGLISPLLKNKSDEDTLPRRGSFWDKKRKAAGL